MTKFEQLGENSNDESVSLFIDTVWALKDVQGFYGRVYNAINDMSDEQLWELQKELEKQKFKDRFDVILWLED